MKSVLLPRLPVWRWRRGLLRNGWCKASLLIFGLILPIICYFSGLFHYSAYSWFGKSMYSRQWRTLIYGHDKLWHIYKDQAHKENSIRSEIVTKWFNETPRRFFKQFHDSENLDVVISINSIHRKGNYVSQELFTLLRFLEKYRKSYGDDALRVGIILCDSTVVNVVHTELIHLANQTGIHYVKAPDIGLSGNGFEQERDGYGFCLAASILTEAKFVMTLEDDVLLKQNFFAVLHQVITAQNTGMINALLVKFFHPYRFLQFYYFSPIYRIVQLIGFSSFVSSLFMFFVWHRYKHYYSKDLWFKVLIFVCVIFIVLGRPISLSVYTLLHRLFGTLILIPYSSCCMPAVLFPRSTAIQYSDLLNDKTFASPKLAKDEFLDHLVRGANKYAFLTIPMTVEHIGFVSAAFGRQIENYYVHDFLGIELE